ncbi:hypothetical protein AAFF_G00242820 [Aldrovandia affinis]|uniref:Integrase catalytic domain-containing protein n=1 Tax=Aldrovandia affinis TaxID=143900 RepID=A0AAD7W328_9TELE|nr:hypothetical protein AAFF_G00242820 [Aldrovandia affinis]
MWHRLRKDIQANACVECQCAKIHHHVKVSLETFEVPERQFDHVNMDLEGHLPPSCEFTYLLTMLDRTTRWPEAILLTLMTTADMARAFIDTWVAWFGASLDISSDCGPQFTSELWSEVAWSLGVKLHCTTAYYLQSNDLCEHFFRSMKATLRACLKDDSW